jgi:hypothetical protein
VAEGLKAVGAEVHRRLDHRARGAAQPRHRVVVDDDMNLAAVSPTPSAQADVI